MTWTALNESSVWGCPRCSSWISSATTSSWPVTSVLVVLWIRTMNQGRNISLFTMSLLDWPSDFNVHFYHQFGVNYNVRIMLLFLVKSTKVSELFFIYSSTCQFCLWPFERLVTKLQCIILLFCKHIQNAVNFSHSLVSIYRMCYIYIYHTYH